MGQARIQVSEQSLFASVMEGLDAESLSFLISAMFGEVDWEITTDQDWLACSPAAGVNAINVAARVQAVFSTQDLDPGVYNATITITDPNAANSPVTIPVTLNVTAVPEQVEVEQCREPMYVTTRVQSVVPSSVTRPGWVKPV